MLDFEIFNNDQRRYVSALFGGSSIAWASPIYNMVISLHLHNIHFSLEYRLTIVFCLLISITSFIGGFLILKESKK